MGHSTGKSSLQRALEREHGRPIEDVVRWAWGSGATREVAAARLGVSYVTAEKWRDRFLLVAAETEEQDVCAAPVG